MARFFGKWPSEFFALCVEEQELVQQFYALHCEKAAYASWPKEDRHWWPRDPPPKQK